MIWVAFACYTIALNISPGGKVHARHNGQIPGENPSSTANERSDRAVLIVYRARQQQAGSLARRNGGE